MRGARRIFLGAAASVGAILSGVLSFPHPGVPSFFDRAILPPVESRRAKPRKVKRRPGGTHRGWRPVFYGPAGPLSREAARRVRQMAFDNQRNSHKPGTVQPRHIFG